MHRSPLLLIVGGSPEYRHILRVLFEHHGYRVRAAEDATDALQLVRSLRPALVITSYPVPLPDGTSLTRRVKSDPETASTPILAFTAHVMPDDFAAAWNDGCDAWLAQPAPPSTVLEKARAMIGSATVLHEGR